MIRYALACEEGHDIRGLVRLGRGLRPASGSQHHCLPRLRRYPRREGADGAACGEAGAAQEAPKPQAARKSYAMLRKLREELTANSDYVGPKFPEEARKIHYDEAPPRSIHGEATSEEASDLDAEGIKVFPLPTLPEDPTN